MKFLLFRGIELKDSDLKQEWTNYITLVDPEKNHNKYHYYAIYSFKDPKSGSTKYIGMNCNGRIGFFERGQPLTKQPVDSFEAAKAAIESHRKSKISKGYEETRMRQGSTDPQISDEEKKTAEKMFAKGKKYVIQFENVHGGGLFGDPLYFESSDEVGPFMRSFPEHRAVKMKWIANLGQVFGGKEKKASVEITAGHSARAISVEAAKNFLKQHYKDLEAAAWSPGINCSKIDWKSVKGAEEIDGFETGITLLFADREFAAFEWKEGKSYSKPA